MKEHILTTKREVTGSSSHYDIPLYSSYLCCETCKWKRSLGHYGSQETKEFLVMRHNIHVLLKEAGITVKVGD